MKCYDKAMKPKNDPQVLSFMRESHGTCVLFPGAVLMPEKGDAAMVNAGIYKLSGVSDPFSSCVQGAQ